MLAVDTVSGTSSFDTPVNATATGTSTLVGSTLVTSIAGAGGIESPEGHLPLLHLALIMAVLIAPLHLSSILMAACPYLAGRFSENR